MAKRRADVLMTERGLAPSREAAQRLILAGKVKSGTERVAKPGQAMPEDAPLEVEAPEHPYVSRGGVKLAAALDAFNVEPSGWLGLDVGASTGGFTDVLLRRGARRVVAVDVGRNQLAWSLRQDPRVRVHEGVNARTLDPALLEGELADIVVADVSFISLVKVLPATLPVATPRAVWITLIKPQFEVGREQVGKGGIVRSDEARQEALARVRSDLERHGLARTGLIESPLRGGDGNLEYLARWERLP